MEKTAWFPASVKPVRKGRYEVRLWISKFGKYIPSIFVYRFDGKQWRTADKNNLKADVGYYHQDKWRGLTRPAAK